MGARMMPDNIINTIGFAPIGSGRYHSLSECPAAVVELVGCVAVFAVAAGPSVVVNFSPEALLFHKKEKL